MREKNKKVMGINGTQIKQKNRKREKCIYRNGYDGGKAMATAAAAMARYTRITMLVLIRLENVSSRETRAKM